MNIMNKCIKCNVYVADITDRCPLCKQVIAQESDEQFNMYPSVMQTTRKFRLMENIVLFISIVVATFLIAIDFTISKSVNWSIIATLGLIYVNVTIRVAIIGRSGYMYKTFSMGVLTVASLIWIDYLLGNRGWAVSAVFPAAIIVMDLAVLILMMTNHRNWQSYIMVQITLILISCFGMILYAVGYIKFPQVIISALVASIFLFLGTLIIGDERARTELKRRFHI